MGAHGWNGAVGSVSFPALSCASAARACASKFHRSKPYRLLDRSNSSPNRALALRRLGSIETRRLQQHMLDAHGVTLVTMLVIVAIFPAALHKRLAVGLVLESGIGLAPFAIARDPISLEITQMGVHGPLLIVPHILGVRASRLGARIDTRSSAA